ncbi:MAG TPA: asparaginase [Gemmatimonadales bacterium]|nr:asparaginase [Gemmatimonadales bacterium]
MNADFRVEATRGNLVESVHRVSLAVVDASGALRASAGNPDLFTFWRSAAKPFQVMPVLADGAADRAGFTVKEVALACASHSSEPAHVETALGMLRKLGLDEGSLACGPHVPLSPAVAESVLRQGVTMTPAWCNCSGKHAAMLALAQAHGWPARGYEALGHPVQERILTEICRWTDLRPDQLGLGVDGCTAVSVALPLRAMALAYARYGVSKEPAAVRLKDAVASHPLMIAGEGRLCTDLLAATSGRVFAKVGADGVYSAMIPAAGLGLALKVEDGDMRSSAPALVAILLWLGTVTDLGFDPSALPGTVLRHAALPTINTRGVETGMLRATGTPRDFA